MGRKLDRLLGRGRGFRPSKLKPLLSLALVRLSVLKAQRQVSSSNSRSDVLQLLQLGHGERALYRVEQVIKDQNMVDVYLLMERYCNLLIERVDLVEQERECPGELKEAVSSLIYASSRCGEFPELIQIRSVFQSYFGKEFVACSIELRNNCGVNTKVVCIYIYICYIHVYVLFVDLFWSLHRHASEFDESLVFTYILISSGLQMIQKMSTLHPSMERRIKLLKEIASENGIVLHLDEVFYASVSLSFEKVYELCFLTLPLNDDFPFLLFPPCEWLMQTDMGDTLMPEVSNPEEASSSRPRRDGDDTETSLDRRESIGLSDSLKVKKKYKDVADAAQAAFESAAYAAAAARAAVELSRSNGSFGPDSPSSPSPREIEKESEEHDSMSLVHASANLSLDSQKEICANSDDDGLQREEHFTDATTSHLSSGRQSSFQSGLSVESDNSPVHLNLAKGPPVPMRTRRIRGY
ncbi:hypothetical protein SAY86_025722 [Trapa natans]|uniref:Uncharacterized protein n=1 Tax=Trapa natans TaxID=22666 RepID=A0AAN7KK08_TRANT|nr:hypothetical protein SAY86_025722 [Trapa natans]